MGTAGSAGPATDALAGDAKGETRETRESRGTGTEKHAKRERKRTGIKNSPPRKLRARQERGTHTERD
jgi:hypothetical protein